jgi:hypothetical protein
LFFFAAPAPAQDRKQAILTLDGVVPGGVRTSATESWGVYDDVNLTNRTDSDRQARVLVFFEGRPDVQYGRDLWIPAHSRLKTWMLVGPTTNGGKVGHDMAEVQSLLYDRTNGTDQLILPTTEERIRSRVVLYRKRDREREPYTAILLDDEPDSNIFGEIPQLPPHVDEARTLARSFRSVCKLSGFVQQLNPGPLAPMPEAFDGIDHFVIASNRIKDDPPGMQALRQWLERGGKVWVMLDRVEPEAVAPLLGDALDFQVVDRVGLTTTNIEPPSRTRTPPLHHEKPVELVRVLLPPQERPRHTIDGWPIWFSRQVGRGKVVFTTLGPRGWYRPRERSEPLPHGYEIYSNHPVVDQGAPLEIMADELLLPPADPYPVEAFRPGLTEEIGYAVISRTTVELVFGAFVLVTLVLGLALRRSRRPELLGWISPAAALAAAVAFFVLGEYSRRAASPTVAVAQVVDAVAGTEEVPVRGLLAAYRPDSGPAPVGAAAGGYFNLDMTGVEGQTRRLIQTDLNAWHWENLDLPAGVRTATFHSSAALREPLAAVAHFGPEGLEGKVHAGAFQELGDALVITPNVRRLPDDKYWSSNLTVHLDPDGTFRASSQDVLPTGQVLASAVLTDQQQRRQKLYRQFLERPATGRREGPNFLLAWAKPLDMQFTLAPTAREVGNALLVIPLQLQRPAPGTRITIPGPFLSVLQERDNRLTPPTFRGDPATDLNLRFQLPEVVLPFEVERARLNLRIAAPSRRVTVAGQGDGGLVELFQVESPLDPLHVEIDKPGLLRLDKQGGLRVHVVLSDWLPGGGNKDQISADAEKWSIEYLELEVIGTIRE